MKICFRYNQFLPLILFFSLLLIVSCQKENSQDPAEEQEASIVSSEADAEAEIVFNEVFDETVGVNNEVGMEGIGSLDRVNPNPCYTVTVTRLNPPDLFPVKVVIDFGSTPCRGLDGHYRRGKIITVYTGRLLNAGSIATTTFDGFYVDTIRVEGTHKIENTSASNLTRQFTVDVTNARLTKPSGNFVEWNNHKVITQLEGLATPFVPLDDVFKIEGSANGRVQRGRLVVAWESNIIEPLFKRFNCRWIVRGKVRTVRRNTNAAGPWVAVLDFGNGTCDNLAVVTINGVSRQITLR
ncbi:hypothetical protein CAP36_16620 [Chitinophagaceae bacterium IBVUCB2]|nr:hypothetical protein CAP36_16620 [Chitinophagaceae bacterium IBVUCB2]